MVHRLSLLPTVALLVLSVAAGTPLLEQLPDVPAQLDPTSDGLSGRAIAAVLALAALTLSIFFTTRVRTGYVRRRDQDCDAEPQKTGLLYWLVGPAAAILAAGWPSSSGRPEQRGRKA